MPHDMRTRSSRYRRTQFRVAVRRCDHLSEAATLGGRRCSCEEQHCAMRNAPAYMCHLVRSRTHPARRPSNSEPKRQTVCHVTGGSRCLVCPEVSARLPHGSRALAKLALNGNVCNTQRARTKSIKFVTRRRECGSEHQDDQHRKVSQLRERDASALRCTHKSASEHQTAL